MDFNLSGKGRRALPQPVTYLMNKGASGDFVSLAAGLVDSETLPAEEVRDLISGLLSERGHEPLQYGINAGLASLREKVRSRVAGQDSTSAADIPLERVVLSTGSQQMLYILTEIMVDPGDIVITSAPSYFVYLGTLQTAGARIVTIPSDRDGMRVDLLAEALEKIEAAGQADRLKIVYVTTYFQNPSGVSLSIERRKALLDTMASFTSMRPLVIEDAAYRELGFSGADKPSMWSFDDGGRNVAYLGTFSKPFSPGFRTGFAFLPENLVEKVEIVKGNHDFGSANFNQHVIDAFLERGLYDKHLSKIRETYRAKCLAMCEAIDREMGESLSYMRPEGGLYVWGDLGEIDTDMQGVFFERCLEEGVLYVPGILCYGEPESAPRSKLRLSFGPACAEEITEGIKRLSKAISSVGSSR
ncbi:MAG: PLP-dependent aminotransferase family protein [Planctomycetes bacterium]|nr:PLP-dependent aminotransferase family protein [Planctomycetota bacterium]